MSVKATFHMRDGSEVHKLFTGWASMIVWQTEHWKDLEGLEAYSLESCAEMRQGKNGSEGLPYAQG